MIAMIVREGKVKALVLLSTILFAAPAWAGPCSHRSGTQVIEGDLMEAEHCFTGLAIDRGDREICLEEIDQRVEPIKETVREYALKYVGVGRGFSFCGVYGYNTRGNPIQAFFVDWTRYLAHLDP